MEGAALAWLRFRPDAGLHRIAEAFAECQAHAGAAVTTRRAAIGLEKRLKQALRMMPGDADARVLHLKVQQSATRFMRRSPHTNLDAAGIGELDRIREELREHLTQKSCLCREETWTLHRDLLHDLQAFLTQRRLVMLVNLLQQRGEVCLLRLDLRTSAFELGKLQNARERGKQ